MSSPEDEVRDRYLDITRRYYERLQNPDPTDPSIAEGHVGASLLVIAARAEKLRALMQFDRAGPTGFPVPAVASVAIEGDVALVRSCVVDDVEVVSRASGEVVNGDIVTQTLETSLRRSARTWKISEQRLVNESQGRHRCQT